jgi:hypothetical protein
MPKTTTWKVENGQWVWYIDPEAAKRESPLGRMMPGAGSPGAAAAPGAAGSLPKSPTPDQIRGGVRPNKKSVILGPDHPKDEVVFTNGMPGWVTLTLAVPEGTAAAVNFDHRQIAPKQSARLVFEYQPKGAVPQSGSKVLVGVEPIGDTFTIIVRYAGSKPPASTPPKPVK